MTTSATNHIASSATTILRGIVMRRSGEQTVAVKVRRTVAHPMYRKTSTVSKTYLVHDPHNQAEVGQEVMITPTRPLSRRKRWMIRQTTAVK